MDQDLSSVQLPTYDPPASAGKSDITLVSSDGAKFNLHLKQLECASDLVLDMVSCATSNAESGIVTLELTNTEYETAEVLVLVMPFCYNVPPPDFYGKSIALVTKAFFMATKWGMHRVLKASGDSLIARASQIDAASSLQLYIHACKFGHGELQEATKERAASNIIWSDTPYEYIDDMGKAGLQALFRIYLSRLQKEVQKAEYTASLTTARSSELLAYIGEAQRNLQTYLQTRPIPEQGTWRKGYVHAERSLIWISEGKYANGVSASALWKL